MDIEKLGHTAITWPFTVEGASAAIAALGRLGYRGTELFGFVIDKYPNGVAGLRDDLERADLGLAAAYCSVSLIEPESARDDIDRISAWADKVVALGGDVVVVGANQRKHTTYTPEDYRGLSTTLSEIGRRCLDKGVKACFHPHTGTPVETPEEIARVMEAVDASSVFMAPDTGQLAKGGGDAVETVKTYASMVRHIHLKDYVGGEPHFDAGGDLVDRTGYLDYLPLGAGVLDFPAIVEALRESGYAGWWMAELDGTPQASVPPEDAAATSKRYLDRLGDR